MTARVSKHIDLERDGLAIQAEYLQTDPWSIDAILRAEILTPVVVDPCCGDGRMAMAALKAGAKVVIASDLNDWGFLSSAPNMIVQKGVDFLTGVDGMVFSNIKDNTVFMNPPFSKACEFVDRAKEYGARKIVCFQRSVWRECQERRAWWDRNPPNRIYQCGNRAQCWYGTIPKENRKGGAYQPHSWFVWEQGQPVGTLQGAVWRTAA